MPILLPLRFALPQPLVVGRAGGRARCVRVGLDTENGSVARAAGAPRSSLEGRAGGWAMLNHGGGGGGKGKLQ